MDEELLVRSISLQKGINCLFEKVDDRYILLVISPGFEKRLNQAGIDTDTFLDTFNAKRHKYIHKEDLVSVHNEMDALPDHPGDEFQLRVRWRYNTNEPFRWQILCVTYYEIEGHDYYWVTAHDIDAQQRSYLDELHVSSRSLELVEYILETTHTCIFWKDRSGYILGANKATLDFFGLDNDRRILNTCDDKWDWFRGEEEYVEGDEKVLEEGETFHAVHMRAYAKGEHRDVLVSKSPIYVMGQIVGIVTNFEDVTTEYRQRQKIERLNADLMTTLSQLEAANKVQNDFLARMSHDMRTPLTAILGLSGVALDRPEEDHREFFGHIKDAADYLLVLINDLLEVEKFDAGKMVPYIKTHRHEEIITTMLHIVLESKDAKTHQFDVKADMNPKYAHLRLDRRWTMQILINVLNNAVKYTPAGGLITFREKIIEMDDNDVLLEYTITDNGVGMSEEFMRMMYEPFAQEENICTHSNTSTGLGLAIVRKACDMLGGEIMCDSKVGEGTRFVITIPAAVASLEEVISHRRKALDKDIGDSLRGKHVLICEDTDINARIVSMILEKYGVTTEIASNGEEGVRVFKRHHFDLILMDVRMPVMNGLEATIEIRRFNQTIPIIGLSANITQEDVDAGINAGMNGYVRKPIKQEELLYTMKDALTA